MSAVAARGIPTAMNTPRERQLAWLQQVLDRTGLKPHTLAMKAGMTAPNLYRFLDEKSGRTLRSATIIRLARAANVAAPDELTGMADGDARPYDYDAKAFSPPDPATQPRMMSFEITSDAAQLAGFEPGDIAIIDTQMTPEPGQLVLAQVYDLRIGDADTVIRYFEPPYLVSASTDPELRKPILIDQKTVSMRGVVVKQLRARNLLQAS